MNKEETGEFELVLGNKQLLSGFFVIVILFGVFFTMGYIVGRNSAPAANMAPGPQPSPAVRPPEPLTARSPAVEPPPQSSAPAPQASEGATEPGGPVTQPAKEPEIARPADAPSALQEPVPGKAYLQVMAVKRPDAEVILKTLKDKGFPAILSPGPDDLVRVLVGPYEDVASLGRAKAELESAGVGHPIVRRY